jgi:uncharacterized protein YigE (DUF2233 family)
VPFAVIAMLSLAAAVIGLFASLPADGQRQAAGGTPPMEVATIRHGGIDYLVAEADMRRVRLRMLTGLRSLHDARSRVPPGERLLLAMNGGLFDAGRPIGLHVEDGRTVTQLNLATRPPSPDKAGNFYYLPNAVLYQTAAGEVFIRESPTMRGRTAQVRDGLQSGPALLLHGRVHRIAGPKNPGVPHERRLAACVLSPARLAIVYAQGATTFGQLTRFLRDGLRCHNALFIDAGLTGIYVPGHADVAARSFAGVLALSTRD